MHAELRYLFNDIDTLGLASCVNIDSQKVPCAQHCVVHSVDLKSSCLVQSYSGAAIRTSGRHTSANLSTSRDPGNCLTSERLRLEIMLQNIE